MLSENNCITKLLGLKDVFVNSIEEKGNCLLIDVETEPKPSPCPCCGEISSYIHDYRKQKIKDLSLRGKFVYLLLKKRRYVCKHCGKRFYEKYPFLPRYHRMAQRVYEHILRQMRSNYSMKSVAGLFNVSVNTVSRIFDIVNYKLYRLPDVISIDEFKGNTGSEKYQVIITNPKNKKVLDILPNRQKAQLFNYFRQFDNRNSVRFVIMDMWESYYDVCKALFPNAKIIIDKYHYVRQVYWALDRVRKRVQKDFVKDKRIYFKQSKKLLFAPYDKLNPDNKQALRIMLSQHFDLQEAWQLKEMFSVFRNSADYGMGKKNLRDFILTAQECNIPEFKDCITALSNWSNPILNSFDYPYTNGFTEGINNKIKVLKRNAYGYRNFERFRNRILHTCA
jgi:transposase